MQTKTATVLVAIVMVVGVVAGQGVVQHKAQGKSAINADLVDGLDASAFSLKTGSTFTGNISMDGNQINDVGQPQAPGDAVPKSYVDTNGIGNLSKTLSINNNAGNNNINMSGSRITNLSDPTNPQDAATRSYVNNNDDFESNTDTQDLSIDGDTISLDRGGSVSITDNVQDGDADDTNEIQDFGDVLGQGNKASTSINMTNNKITNLSDPTNPQDAATKSYVDTTDNTIQDDQTLQDVLALNNTVGGENINFNQTSSIQASGTNAITLDNQQNVGLPNGDLNITDNNITASPGSEPCIGRYCG